MRYKGTLATIIIALIVAGSSSVYYLTSVPPRIPAAIYRLTETFVIMNNGSNALEFGGISTEAFLDFAWQEPLIVRINHNYTLTQDKEGNPRLLIDGPLVLESGEEYNATVVWEIKSFQRPMPDMSIGGSGPLGDIPLSLVNYTKQVAPWWSPPDVRLNTSHWEGTSYYGMSIQEVAASLREGSENVLEIVLKNVEWIALHIEYYSASPTYPIETARNQTGDCDDQSNLLIALLRLQGIPSFLMMGQLYLESEIYANVTGTYMQGHAYYEWHHTAGHAWVMVYIPPWGWIPCDPVAIGKDENPMGAITYAVARSPITLVYGNVTGVYESADYITSGRETTGVAVEENIYFRLIQDMEELAIPNIYAYYLQPPVVILAAGIVGSGVMIAIVGAYELRKARSPPPSFPDRVRCPHCGAINPVDAIYCGQCGGRIA